MYGGRRESRNAVPIEVKVAAISKIQSGRRPDTVSIDMDLPVGMINKWWLQREDIRTQFERYCAAQEHQEKQFQRSLERAGSSTESQPGCSKDLEEEVPDDKDEDFTPDFENNGKVDAESGDEKRISPKRKKKKEVHSPYKRRKRVELPTKQDLAPEPVVEPKHNNKQSVNPPEPPKTKIIQKAGKNATPKSKKSLITPKKKTPKSKLRMQVKKMLINSPRETVKRNLVRANTMPMEENKPVVRISSPSPVHMLQDTRRISSASRRSSTSSRASCSTPVLALTQSSEQFRNSSHKVEESLKNNDTSSDPSYAPSSCDLSQESDSGLNELLPFLDSDTPIRSGHDPNFNQIMNTSQNSNPSVDQPLPFMSVDNLINNDHGVGSYETDQSPMALAMVAAPVKPPASFPDPGLMDRYNQIEQNSIVMPPVQQHFPSSENPAKSSATVPQHYSSFPSSQKQLSQHHPPFPSSQSPSITRNSFSSFNSSLTSASIIPNPKMSEAPKSNVQLKAVNIKKELPSSGEYIEDTNFESNQVPSSNDSLVNRYYSQIGSEPSSQASSSSVTMSPAMIKQEARAVSPPLAPSSSAPYVPVESPAVSSQPVNIKAERQEIAPEREASVSPPVSDYPLVPVSDNESSFDSLIAQPSYPAAVYPQHYQPQPPQPMVVAQPQPLIQRGRGAPVRGRGQVARVRGQPIRPQAIRGQPISQRGQSVSPRGQLVVQRGMRGRGQPPIQRGAPISRGRVLSVRGGQSLNRGQTVRGQPAFRGQPVRGQPLTRGQPLARGQQPMRGQPPLRGQAMRGQPVLRGQPSLRGQTALRGQQTTRGLRGGPQPRGGRIASSSATSGQYRPPAPLPEKLANMNGLSIIRQQPVSLPKEIRLPAGITLSHPRGIQNQPPAIPASSSASRQTQNYDPEPPRKKVTMELSQKQIDALKSLGML